MRKYTFSGLGLLFVLGLPLLLGSSAVQAQAEAHQDERAKAHFQAGQDLFDTGSYEEAIAEFEQAHRLSGRARLLYNLYLCHERLGNLEAAIDHLARYLDADPEAANTPALRVRLANLRRRAEAARVGEVGPETEPAPAEPLTEVPESAPTETRSHGKAGVITALSLSGAGFVSFGAFAVLAAKKDSELDRTCADACTNRQVQDLRTYSMVADISLGVGVAGLIVGGTLWLVGRRSRSPDAVRVEPLLSQQNLGLTAQGRF